MNRILIALLLFGCGQGDVKSKGDDCQRYIEKMAPTFAGEDGKYSDEDKARFVYECRKTISPLRPDPTMQCVLDAKNDAGIKLCMQIADEAKPKKPEAEVQLNRIGKNAKVVYIVTQEFPKGTAKLLPPKRNRPGEDARGSSRAVDDYADSSSTVRTPESGGVQRCGRMASMSDAGWVSTRSKTSRRYASGSTSCRSQVAISE